MLSRRQFAMGAGLAVTGCAPTPRLLFGPEPAAAANLKSVLVATTRRPSPDPEFAFEGKRSDRLAFAEYEISVPPDRRPGSLELPRRNPDPQTQFLAHKQLPLNERDVLNALNARLARLPRGKRTVVLFVHGYNVSHPGAVFRSAQIATDFDLSGPMFLYSWPSAGKVTLYAYDRDSALFARKGLAQTLALLGRSNAEGIVILAHSLGTFLTMETLRSLALSGQRSVLRRISGVVLAQPDIDVDVFRTQVSALDLPRLAIIVFASRRDRALTLSTFIAGGHPRVGSAANIEDLRRLGIVVVDVSNVTDAGLAGHSAFASSPALLSIIRSGKLADTVLSGAPGQDIVLGGATLASSAALAVAYLPYLLTGN